MLIISDTHGEHDILCKILSETSEENIIMLGDNGFGVDGFSTEYLSREFPSKTIYCIQGNHDNSAYMKSLPNVYTVLCRNPNPTPVIRIEGKDCLFIPGAYSFDKSIQISRNTWYEDEQMNYRQWDNFLGEIENGEIDFNLIFSHDAPLTSYYRFYDRTEVSITNRNLQWLYENLVPQHVEKYHGHLHFGYSDNYLNITGLAINQTIVI